MSAFLRRPCKNCPFRTDIPPFLRRAGQIAEALRSDLTFTCHETTIYDDETEDLHEGPGSRDCAGSMIVLSKEGLPNQMMRIGQRMGVFDPEQLDMEAPVFDSLDEFVAHHKSES